MKAYIILLVLLFISVCTLGQKIQNGQDGSNFTTINQISGNEQMANADQGDNQNSLIKTYNDEIWVIEFTSDSTFVISDSMTDLSEFEGRGIAVPKEMIAKAALNGLVEAYHNDSTNTPIENLESQLGMTLHQITRTRNIDMLLYTEHQLGNKSGLSEYQLLEDMVGPSEYDVMGNEKEFYKELDNMVSGILVNIINKQDAEVDIPTHERINPTQLEDIRYITTQRGSNFYTQFQAGIR